MSTMANTTPVITTVRNIEGLEKMPKETNTAPRASIQEFCDKHYDDILPIVMERARQDKRKGLQSRLDFGDTPKKIRRVRSNSPSPRDETPPVRYRQRTKDGDKGVFGCLSQRKKSAFERLSGTYSPSTTKTGPSSRGRSSERSSSRIGYRPRGVEESYGDTYSSQRTRHGNHSRDNSRREEAKKRRRSESPFSRASVSGSSRGTHLKSGRYEPADEDDLAMPWTCDDAGPFTSRISNFRSSRKTRMPNNVKTYDGTGDPEDHLKVFQSAAQVEHWAMPTWCHMFNSTLIGSARVWFDELPAKSIDGYKDLKTAFLAYFMQQKKYVKDPVEIHNIKQKEGETIEEFMERFKNETGRMKGAPECMRISGFMHGVNNPELIKCLNERVPKTMEEMMTAIAAFVRGETAAAGKKIQTPWKTQDQSKRHASDRKLEFQKFDF
ncbi:reverse transcriptase domain-containing protein [Tanacetum coccineum]